MPKYLILNAAVGGDFPNNVANLEGTRMAKRSEGRRLGWRLSGWLLSVLDDGHFVCDERYLIR